MNKQISIHDLGRWLEDNCLSRGEFAKSLGISRNTVDTWFSRQTVPRSFHRILQKIMHIDSEEDLLSRISLPLDNETLNKIAKKAVSQNIEIEEWILRNIKKILQEQ